MNNNRKYKITLAAIAIAALGMMFCPTIAVASHAARVTNGNDDGSGSLRAALESSARLIVIDKSVSTITTSSALEYDDPASLTIVGSGQTIDGSSHGETLFVVTQGADLTISNLAFDGGGGYDIFNQGGGKGIFVDVPLDRTGIVRLMLNHVSVSGVGDHGIHVSDCDAVPCGAGGGGGGDGSPASIHAMLSNVTVFDVGNGSFDSDGVRIDDRDEGDIVFKVFNSTFVAVGADGVELDEGDDGHVIVAGWKNLFEHNGGYCAPIDLTGFPTTEVPVDDGPGFPPTADDRCVEWDETEYVLDLDDGFDIDEAGRGSLYGWMVNNEINFNLDEGLDFDEEGEGGIDVDLVGIHARGNGDEGIKVSEENAGDVTVRIRRSVTIDNSDDGIQIEEADGGDLAVRVDRTMSFDNSKAGLNVTEDGDGEGTLRVRRSHIDSIDTNVTEL